MNQSNVDLLDLPNEILLIILKKLDNKDVLYSLLDVDNQRLDIIVQENIFTNTLNSVLTTFTDDISSVSDTIVDRFCINILPRIHHNIKSLIVDSVSMERILLVTDYPNLTELKLFSFNEHESSLTKVELLEIAVKCAPSRRYKVDEAAKRFDVKILRLSVRHCVLNLVELAWAGFKNYIRNNNTNFRLVDVHNLAIEYLAAVDKPLSTSYFQHAKKYEDRFKEADKYVQEMVDPILDESDDDDEIFDDNSSDDGSLDDSEETDA
ncbi:unnamed protein product [Rotaria sordida]|uniref:F-box domain-containing protein n=1 Tax=Rotaria sordida TaxID=392033 RepID=A0A814S0N5_9BILA|nr:unnamed protein product [Rotaria sordida]CAF1140931.1 unnamed protein product [Rotaria sordida]